MTYCTRYRSPLGEMVIAANGAGLIGVHFEGQRYFPDHVMGWRAAPEHAVIAAAQRQLDEYFAGSRASFSAPLVLRGTPFQRLVWEELRRIPFGETLTYSELAACCRRRCRPQPVDDYRALSPRPAPRRYPDSLRGRDGAKAQASSARGEGDHRPFP